MLSSDVQQELVDPNLLHLPCFLPQMLIEALTVPGTGAGARMTVTWELLLTLRDLQLSVIQMS